jgi:hypothetical protein
MAGKQRAALEEKARTILADMEVGDATLLEPGMVRPPAARFEIVHPLLRGCRQSERSDQMCKMLDDGTAAAVMLELAQMTRRLRDAGIRATADYALGTLVISWGAPPKVDTEGIRQSLASQSGGEPVPDDSVLVAWAGSPRSEVDALTPALRDAMRTIAPYARGRQSGHLEAAATGQESPPRELGR